MVVDGKIGELQITRTHDPALDEFPFEPAVSMAARHIIPPIRRKVEFARDELEASVRLTDTGKDDGSVLVAVPGKKVREKLGLHRFRQDEPPRRYCDRSHLSTFKSLRFAVSVAGLSLFDLRDTWTAA